MSTVLNAMNRRNAARRAYDKSEGGEVEAVVLDAADVEVRRVDKAFDAMLDALREIVKGEGAYNRDPLEHASNCIEHMQDVAREAIAKVEAQEVAHG